MQTRCKLLDLAIITKDEPGLEDNIGRLVQVVGGPLSDGDYGPVFLIVPSTDEGLLVLQQDGAIATTDVSHTYHPDGWMVPIWRSASHSANAHPRLSRAWLNAVMASDR